MATILIRQDFTGNRAKPFQDDAGNFPRNDVDEKSVNLLMLQTRQALGTLSMAFTSLEAQGVLKILANTAYDPMTGSQQAE
jgi:hypothetical protein